VGGRGVGARGVGVRGVGARFGTFRAPAVRRFRRLPSFYFYSPGYAFNYGSPYGYGGAYGYGDAYGYGGIGPDGFYFPEDYGDWPPPPDDLVPPYPPLPEAPTDDTARIHVLVPPAAQLWFEDRLTTKRGPRRDFFSPKLTPGKTYLYTIRARWKEDDRWVEQKGEFTVRANQTTFVRFPLDEPDELPAPREQKRPKKKPVTGPSGGSPPP
jgi:uncharacterized protein (TIGR03000 family)